MQPSQRELPKLPIAIVYVIALASAACVAFVAYFVIHTPLQSWRDSVERDVAAVRTNLSKGPALRRRHAEKKQLLAELLERVEVVNRRIPDQPREGEFLASLSRLAQQHNVTIEDFRRGRMTEAPTHSVVSVSVTARASHGSLCALVDSVANLPRLAELTNLEVESDGDRDGYPVTLSYDLYYGMSAANAAEGAASG